MYRYLIPLICLLIPLTSCASKPKQSGRDSFEWDGSIITKYIGEETDVVIPQGVTEIGDHAFLGCSSVTSVVIPPSVTVIGNGAFRDCRSLTAIEIPEGVVKIGNSAFKGCIALTSAAIPESAKEIGDGAFAKCPNLTIHVPEGTEGERYAEENQIAFPDKQNKMAVNEAGEKEETPQKADVPGSKLEPTSRESFEWDGTKITKFIGKEAFVIIPEGVTKIGNSAFRGCSSIKSVLIPEGVTEIGERAFQDCRSLTSVEVPEGVTVIGNWAFSLCLSLASVKIPDSVKELGRGAFEGCLAMMGWQISSEHPYFQADGAGLLTKDGKTLVACLASAEEYRIPDGVTMILGSAFSYCGSLTSVEFPESVTEIGEWAFYFCRSLTSAAIPDSVKVIRLGAFEGCMALKEWQISSTHPYFKTDGVGLLTKDGKTLVACLPSTREYRVPEGVTEIGASAIAGCKALTSVEIPDGVTRIGLNAFWGCGSLTSVVIPESVTEIENHAFTNCPNLTIHAPAGSAAEKYAKEHNIPFEVK